MKKKGKSKTNHRKSEGKNEFECFRNESLMFQRGVPQPCFDPQQLPWPFCNCLNPHVTQGHFVFISTMTPFLKPLGHLVLAPHVA
jgi:hypothetical protein